MFLTSVRRLLLRVVRVCARLSGTCGRGGTVSIAEVDLLPLFHDPALVRLPLMSSPPALARAVATNSVTDQGHRPDQISAGLLVDHLIRIPARNLSRTLRHMREYFSDFSPVRSRCQPAR